MTKNRIPDIGEKVYYWRFGEFSLDAVQSAIVVHVERPGDPGFRLGYIVVRLRKEGAKSGSFAIHGANPSIKNDRDGWFFTEEECRQFVQSEIERRENAIAKYA
ncbi:hypothetical protein AB835_14690 [Candidatus Endobugula sertula]|uniref:Uncharacterized protein n=1 Tax=Candidatus Endobugula sertula TaxID=62101 RepID=A0A1D2QLA3_9GAMM|nr:hypothetical protein AB835_14690 [Candidatus Endobugula sertula]